jgi:hypothetical protein
MLGAMGKRGAFAMRTRSGGCSEDEAAHHPALNVTASDEDTAKMAIAMNYSDVLCGAASLDCEEASGVFGSSFRFRFSSFLAFLARSR